MTAVGPAEATLVTEADQGRNMPQAQIAMSDQGTGVLQTTLLHVGQRRDPHQLAKQRMEVTWAECAQRRQPLDPDLFGKVPVDPGIEAADVDSFKGASPGNRRRSGCLTLEMQVDCPQQQCGNLAMKCRKLLQLSHQGSGQPAETSGYGEETRALEQTLQALAITHLRYRSQRHIEHQRTIAAIAFVFVMKGAGNQAATPTGNAIAEARDLEFGAAAGRQNQLMVRVIMSDVLLPQVAGTQVE